MAIVSWLKKYVAVPCATPNCEALQITPEAPLAGSRRLVHHTSIQRDEHLYEAHSSSAPPSSHFRCSSLQHGLMLACRSTHPQGGAYAQTVVHPRRPGSRKPAFRKTNH